MANNFFEYDHPSPQIYVCVTELYKQIENTTSEFPTLQCIRCDYPNCLNWIRQRVSKLKLQGDSYNFSGYRV